MTENQYCSLKYLIWSLGFYIIMLIIGSVWALLIMIPLSFCFFCYVDANQKVFKEFKSDVQSNKD